MSQTQPTLQSGEHVRILDAEPGAPDAKSLVYYDYYRNLTGTVVKAYPDGTVAISIDRETLPEPVRKRHETSERMQRDRWLNGLSDEDRNKLTERERNFTLRYTLLVSAKHVVPEKAQAHSGKTRAPKSSEAAADPAPARKTTADLEAAEKAYLEAKKIS